MDYAEEQAQELEALEAILMDDLQVQAEVVFAHTPRYPEEPPLVQARSLKGLSDADVAALQLLVDGQVTENLGMPMIYTIIAAAQEWLRDKAAEGKAPVIDPAAAKKAAEEAEERRLAELRALGTPVTPDTFNAWKAQFYAESALARTRLQEESDRSRRLTGKQFFQQQASHANGKDEVSPEDSDVDTDGDEVEDDTDFGDEDDDELLDQLEEQLAAGR